MVTDSYSRGVVDVLDLLDAQNAAEIAAQGRAVRVHSEMISDGVKKLVERFRKLGIRKDEFMEMDRLIRGAYRKRQRVEQEGGMTVDALRSRYRQGILVQRTVQSEIQPTEITEEEVRRRYQKDMELFKLPAKVDLEQLFFPVAESGSNQDEVHRVARGLVERVSNGSDLRAEATLAGIEVQPLGAIPAADLRNDLRRALEGVPDGGFTEPLTTAGGVQVIHLVKRIPEGYQPFEEVEEDIKRRMSADSYQAQSQAFVEKLMEEYLVEIDQRQLDHILDMVETL